MGNKLSFISKENKLAFGTQKTSTGSFGKWGKLTFMVSSQSEPNILTKKSWGSDVKNAFRKNSNKNNKKNTITMKYRTFTDMKWKTTIKFDEKERKKKTSKLEFKGIEPDEFSFKMRLSVFGGMNPLKEMNKINKEARKGKAYRLIIGGKKYGKSKLVITSISRDLQFIDKKGNLWVAELQISMKEKP